VVGLARVQVLGVEPVTAHRAKAGGGYPERAAGGEGFARRMFARTQRTSARAQTKAAGIVDALLPR
jgi:hypothetical protein